jgi:hypothetical protein
VVVVGECTARAPPVVFDAGAAGDVGEGAVAVVLVQRVGPEGRDVDVLEPVVVVVGDAGAGAPAAPGQAGFLGDVAKVARPSF